MKRSIIIDALETQERQAHRRLARAHEAGAPGELRQALTLFRAAKAALEQARGWL
jgi:hypothetical protein